VINPQFEAVGDFQNGKAIFSNGKSIGFIDTKGAYIINPQFDRASNFSEGLATIKQGKVWGYIKEDGKIEINPQFDAAGDFQNGLALIVQDGKCGYIDKTGKIQINPQFDDASGFFGDIAFVENADKWGIIDKKGKYLVNPQFDRIKTDLDSYVVSDYYDASGFISKFFEKAGDNSFDGFTATSTLQNIIDNPLYDNINANDKYTAYTYTKQTVTDDITVSKTSFHFTNQIYENVTTYNNYWGYRYATGTTKQYKFTEKIAAIEYQFDLSGDASDKGGAVANAMKMEIESRYGVKLTGKDGEYNIATEGNKFGFTVTYSDYSLTFRVDFAKVNMGTEEVVEIEYEEDYD